jgi:EpsI family protein
MKSLSSSWYADLLATPSHRTALLVTVLMFVAAAAAIVARPTAKLASELPAISLEDMIPKSFGAWRDEPLRTVQVVNPQTQELLDRIYSQILNRVYVNEQGYRVMLAVAYGSEQRGNLVAHKPEVCYPAQGFVVHQNEAGDLATGFGVIPVRRLFTSMGARKEPLTYWFTVGDTAARDQLQRRLLGLRYALTGRIPDGILFRISSIDPDQPRAYQQHEQFVAQLLQAISPADRRRLSGLGGS